VIGRVEKCERVEAIDLLARAECLGHEMRPAHENESGQKQKAGCMQNSV